MTTPYDPTAANQDHPQAYWPTRRIESAGPEVRAIDTPTMRAVSSCVNERRCALDLTYAELSYVLELLGHRLGAHEIYRIENCTRAATVDDLTALAAALDVSPLQMLTHEPPEQAFPPFEPEPPCTGLPADVGRRELIAWMHGQTTMASEDRTNFAGDDVARAEIAATFWSDQLAGAQQEYEDLGNLVDDPEHSEKLQPLRRILQRLQNKTAEAERQVRAADARYEDLVHRAARTEAGEDYYDPEPLGIDDLGDEPPFG